MIRSHAVTPGLRVGLGEDRHRLVAGGPLRLGGIDIPFDYRLHGHSDADAVLHAVTDALLGAAALGDIGTLFPNTDPANRGRDSADMLQIAWQSVAKAGYSIVNLDIVVHIERPKLAPHREAICRRIGEILSLTPQQIGFKAKTGEGVGVVGRGEAVDVRCVALITQVP